MGRRGGVEGICSGVAGMMAMTVGVCVDGGMVKRWEGCYVHAWMIWKCSGWHGKRDLLRRLLM